MTIQPKNDIQKSLHKRGLLEERRSFKDWIKVM